MKKSIWRRVVPLFLALMLTLIVLSGCQPEAPANTSGGDTGTSTDPGTQATTTDGGDKLESFPRNETLYFNGLQWGPAANFNPFAPTSGFVLQNNTSMPFELVYETLFMYNQLDASVNPLLAKEFSWDGQSIVVKLNPDAKWNDGEAFNADDVVYTFNFAKKYTVNISAIWDYIDAVEKVDEYTVKIVGKASNYNPQMMKVSLTNYYMVPQHVWEGIEADCGNDGAQILQFFNENPVSSGAYKVYISDDTKIALIRDDNYWGQAASMFGKLPAPKYLVHNLFKDNAAGDEAFKAGQVDVSQQFVSQIWKMWEGGAPIETYLPDAPYYIPGQIPSIIFNTTKPGLDDPAVRKAIAMSLDYEMIGQNAMSGYTAPMVPSLMLPTDPEQALIDAEALKQYQWTSKDVDKANALLDEAGWVMGADGVREKDGVKLSFTVECPDGWTDWNASLEIVAQCSKTIGMDIQTLWTDMNGWLNNCATGNFDIIMRGYEGVSVSSPWAKAFQTMYSKGNQPMGENATWNYGRYSNARADEIIDQIAIETDAAKLKSLWTELNIIYLEDVPNCGLMYRPLWFNQVNTSVWEGFPKFNDGTNIPPTVCVGGYGVLGLYHIHAK